MVKSSRFGIIDSAKIVLTSKYSETTFTDGTGFYAFTRVTPGNYSIMAKISNNEVKVIKNIEMRAGEIREINFEF
jgi:ABC-type branched-subunit amino acid transport system substrate-binding protein